MTEETSRIPLTSEERSLRLVEVGIALSAETDLDVLLGKIVTYARHLTGADAGTLYITEGDRLHFKIIQNDTLGIFEGGATGEALTLEPVPLERATVAGYVALEGEPVNIADVYASERFDFTGPKRYDERSGYRSRSMLGVPMRDHEGRVIGVLQLLNYLDPATGEVGAFPGEVEALASSLASQAAVAITNARLILEVKSLFDALVRVLAAAVDAKSPYTGNHVQRVALLNQMIAQAINEDEDGPFADVSLDRYELEELRLAGWLHDVGKVTTPTWVMDKATKLQGIFDRIETVRTRFELAGAVAENRALRARLEELGEDPDETPAMDRARGKMRELIEDFEFVERLNTPREYVDDGMMARLTGISAKTFPLGDHAEPLLTEDETYNLAIRKGSLNPEEIDLMRDHVNATTQILAAVPFHKTGSLKNVPLYAGQHHEKLNARGYPDGLAGDELPLQSRILAVADFYEALSAKDRPYKEPTPPEMVLKIMRSAAEEGEIDGRVLELMISRGVHERFERAFEKGEG